MSEHPGCDNSPSQGRNWYYCNDGETVVGPFPVEAIQALLRCGTITAGSRVAPEGATDWQTLEEAFGSTVARLAARDSTAPEGPGAQNRSFISNCTATAEPVVERFKVWAGPRKKTLIAGGCLVLLLAVGWKVHAKAGRERAAREFRERAVVEGAGRDARSPSVAKRKANRGAFELYMQGYNDPKQGEVARLLSERAAGDDLKAYALIVLGAEDREKGLPVRFEVDE